MKEHQWQLSVRADVFRLVCPHCGSGMESLSSDIVLDQPQLVHNRMVADALSYYPADCEEASRQNIMRDIHMS